MNCLLYLHDFMPPTGRAGKGYSHLHAAIIQQVVCSVFVKLSTYFNERKAIFVLHVHKQLA